MAIDPRHSPDSIRLVADPVRRLRRLAAAADANAAHALALRDLRVDAVRELRAKGWTGERIGALLGVTSQRVGQISRLPKGART